MEQILLEVKANIRTYLKFAESYTDEDDFIDVLINSAKDDIINKCRPFGATDTQKLETITKYKNILQSIVMFDYCREGAEFQTSHSENSISRSWESKDKLLDKVISFADC